MLPGMAGLTHLLESSPPMTYRSHSRRPQAAAWQQGIAWLGVMLVLALNLVASTPQLHAWLHPDQAADRHAECTHSQPVKSDATHSDSEDLGCVVTQFAHGKLGVELAVSLAVEARLEQLAGLENPAWVRPTTPLHRLPPGCGPPAV